MFESEPHKNGYREFIKFLIVEINVDVNEKEGLEELTPLMSVASAGLDNACIALLRPGMIEEKSNLGWTPLCFAAFNGYKNMVKKLIAHGANVLVKDKKNNTVLMIACKGADNLQVVKELLSTQAIEQIDAQNKNGMTALMLASGEMNLKIVDLLLSSGADANIKNKDGQTALQIRGLCKQYRINKHTKSMKDIIEHIGKKKDFSFKNFISQLNKQSEK